jgi:cytosine deaminase
MSANPLSSWKTKKSPDVSPCCKTLSPALHSIALTAAYQHAVPQICKSEPDWLRSVLPMNPEEMLAVAIEEARLGLAEGGIPIGAALFTGDGRLLGRGHNRRVQEDNPSIHGETDAFRKAGRQRSYRNTIMATTLSPCWYCSGLVRQFGIGTVIVGESETFQGGIDWLRENGVTVIVLNNAECKELLGSFIAAHPEVWNEDIGE